LRAETEYWDKMAGAIAAVLSSAPEAV
jgi:hypothetical protein